MIELFITLFAQLLSRSGCGFLGVPWRGLQGLQEYLVISEVNIQFIIVLFVGPYKSLGQVSLGDFEN